MKTNLSLTPNGAQRCATADRVSQSNLSPFELLTQTRNNKPLRIPHPVITAHPVMRGERHYLRALRAAEMDAWEAGRLFVSSQLKV